MCKLPFICKAWDLQLFVCDESACETVVSLCKTIILRVALAYVGSKAVMKPISAAAQDGLVTDTHKKSFDPSFYYGSAS